METLHKAQSHQNQESVLADHMAHPHCYILLEDHSKWMGQNIHFESEGHWKMYVSVSIPNGPFKSSSILELEMASKRSFIQLQEMLDLKRPKVGNVEPDDGFRAKMCL